MPPPPVSCVRAVTPVCVRTTGTSRAGPATRRSRHSLMVTRAIAFRLIYGGSRARGSTRSRAPGSMHGNVSRVPCGALVTHTEVHASSRLPNRRTRTSFWIVRWHGTAFDQQHLQAQHMRGSHVRKCWWASSLGAGRTPTQQGSAQGRCAETSTARRGRVMLTRSIVGDTRGARDGGRKALVAPGLVARHRHR